MLGPLSVEYFSSQRVDLVFYTVLLISILAFLMGEGFWLLRKMTAPVSEKVYKKHLEVAWSIVPLAVLLALTFVDHKIISTKKMQLLKIQYQEKSSPTAPAGMINIKQLSRAF